MPQTVPAQQNSKTKLKNKTQKQNSKTKLKNKTYKQNQNITHKQNLQTELMD